MKTNTLNKGFSLLEMIVAIGVFSLAVVFSLSTLISLSNESRKAQATRAVMENLGATIESMSRAIRMGKGFQCNCPPQIGGQTTPADCQLQNGTGGNNDGSSDGPYQDTLHNTQYGDCLAFMPATGSGGARAIIYRLVPGPNTASGYIERSEDGGQNYLRFTTPDINIQRLKFYVLGAGVGSQSQPFIIISIGGISGSGKNTTNFDIQTSITPRTPNFSP